MLQHHIFARFYCRIEKSNDYFLCSFVTRGGVSKGPAPVQSLRDLMQEEEQRQSGKKSENQVVPSASGTSKSASARKKLKYIVEPSCRR